LKAYPVLYWEHDYLIKTERVTYFLNKAKEVLNSNKEEAGDITAIPGFTAPTSCHLAGTSLDRFNASFKI
jgi:hypothetical protein